MGRRVFFMKRPAIAALFGAIALTGSIVCLLQFHPQDERIAGKNKHPSGKSNASVAANEFPGRSRDTSFRFSKQVSGSSQASPALEQLRKSIGNDPVNTVCRSVDLIFSKHEEEAALTTLQEICSKEREAVVQYSLAAGDGSSTRIKLALYQAALNHASEVIQSTARIEIENITGEALSSPDEVRKWLESHGLELRQEEAQALTDQELLNHAE